LTLLQFAANLIIKGATQGCRIPASSQPCANFLAVEHDHDNNCYQL
jgi:hypothetical protein